MESWHWLPSALGFSFVGVGYTVPWNFLQWEDIVIFVHFSTVMYGFSNP